jgi:hypothetical protein
MKVPKIMTAMSLWEIMPTGKNGKIDWYYMPTPSSVPRPK